MKGREVFAAYDPKAAADPRKAYYAKYLEPALARIEEENKIERNKVLAVAVDRKLRAKGIDGIGGKNGGETEAAAESTAEERRQRRKSAAAKRREFLSGDEKQQQKQENKDENDRRAQADASRVQHFGKHRRQQQHGDDITGIFGQAQGEGFGRNQHRTEGNEPCALPVRQRGEQQCQLEGAAEVFSGKRESGAGGRAAGMTVVAAEGVFSGGRTSRHCKRR